MSGEIHSAMVVILNYGYYPSHRASSPIELCQLLVLDDGHKGVNNLPRFHSHYTTVQRPEVESKRSQTRWRRCQKVAEKNL